MSFSPIAFIAPNYRDYKTDWLKAFEPGTTTPKTISLNADGSTLVIKVQLNADGFPVSAGGAIVIPHLNGPYDLWLFPTEAEADASDTSNALRLADNISADGQGGSGANFAEETATLTEGQQTVVFSAISANRASIYVGSAGVDRGRLINGTDYTVTGETTIFLTDSFPAGTLCVGISDVLVPEPILSFVKDYLTLSECINDVALNDGDVASVAERFAGEGGGGTWDVVLSSGVTVDSFNIVQCVGVPTLALKKRDVVTRYVEQSGNGIGLNFMQQLNANRRDVNLLIQSDSTGDEQVEWVYKVAVQLADLFPTYSVNYYLWDDTTNNYLVADSLSTGTGTFALDIYNGAKAGSTAQYFTANRKPNVYAGKTFDLIIQNYGHNQTSAGTLNKTVYRLTESVSQLIADNQDTEIALTLQNIDTSVEDFTAIQVQATKIVADLFGLGIIDIRSIFRWKQLNGVLGDWMNDSVHPNSVGQTVWANTVMDALKNPLKQKQNKIDSLSENFDSWTINSHLDNWVWTEAAPLGWTQTFTTLSKELTIKETLSWSTKCEGNDVTTGTLTQNINGILTTRKQGSGLLFAARVYVPEGNTTDNAGRVDIASDLGSEASSQYGEVFGAFSWRIVYIEPELLDGAETLTASIFTGETGDTCYVDRVFCGYSRLPKETNLKIETKSDYYDPSNVAAKATNVITVIDDSVTIDSTGEAFPSWHIDVFGMIPNEDYTFTWTYVGGGTGKVIAREETNDKGPTILEVTPLSVGTMTWKPVFSSCSLQISNSVGTEPFTLNDIKIIKA